MAYYVYIMTNVHHTVLYVGVTNNLESRVFDHKVKRHEHSFTAKYNCGNLVYYEEFGEIKNAIDREKQLKRYKRKWKEELIENMNSDWKDPSEGWYDLQEFELFKKFDH
jgi:putative endonuclease